MPWSFLFPQVWTSTLFINYADVSFQRLPFVIRDCQWVLISTGWLNNLIYPCFFENGLADLASRLFPFFVCLLSIAQDYRIGDRLI